ncbi:hypothetical protein HJFPF1_01533 [Paramyrothecium foliicola]|nr:hypothetical protein HJFPF1_01533 [Paramyrothecium foliicola]
MKASLPHLGETLESDKGQDLRESRLDAPQEKHYDGSRRLSRSSIRVALIRAVKRSLSTQNPVIEETEWLQSWKSESASPSCEEAIVNVPDRMWTHP